MTFASRRSRRGRRGTVLPMLGVCLIGLFGFVALAVDLGMLAVSRTQSQNAADVAALVGTRTLNNRDGVAFNNLPAATDAVRAVVASNPHLSANLTSAQIGRIEAGQYMYDATSQTFRVATWTDVTTNGNQTAAGGSWTALRITISVAQPTYFLRVFGVTSMPSGAVATAVYRPRDIAFVLDMTGSMAFSSVFNYNNQSLNPDPLVPTAGHYTNVQGMIRATANQANGSGEAQPRNNFVITTPGGPPIVRSYYYDPSNWSNPTTPAFPLSTTGGGAPNLLPAFHRWSPPESGADPTNYVAPNYTWAGYNPMHRGNEANPMGPTPAPGHYGSMTDVTGLPYTGDRWRRRDGRIDKTTTDWASGNNQAAFHTADLLGYTGANPPTTGVSPAFRTDWLDFRDPVWERWGYDLDVVKYRAQRGANGPMNPDLFKANNGNSDDNILLPAADRYQGFSMGPGYWGKTFYIWPPDPRDPAGSPGDPGYQPGDWRRRYFFKRSAVAGLALSAQEDNNTTNTGTTNVFDPINEVVLNTSGSGQTINSAAQVNYAAILRWLKSGPQVLPPNLRAGRVLYYSSIPDDVNTGTGTAQQQLDKAFWRGYIDFVLGINSSANYTGGGNLYGPADSWAASGASVTTADLATYKFSWQTLLEPATRPHMRYTDSPRRPRLHMWFGPLSMMDFLSAVGGNNWTAGTVYEAQCWQLKAGVNAVLDDVKNNQPNAFAGLVYFSLDHHNGVRVPLGQNYTRMKNALFYPRGLVDAITGGDITTEYRPYTNTSLGGYNRAEIPNAAGSTDPATGLSYAFNLLSPSTIPAATAVGTGAGRRGAQKVVIFETDGVPNSYRVPTLNPRGFNSYYTLGGTVSANNGDTTNMDLTVEVVRQIVKPMATTATTTGAGPDSGLSLPNAPAKVYPIAFGDLFDEVLAPSATFRPTALQFLARCAEAGGTGTVGATTLPDTQIITGPFDQRINRLRDCLERIFQSGVSVTLVE